MLVRQIKCDSCGAIGDEAEREPAWLMRNNLGLQGWACGLPGAVDLCPACAEALNKD